MMIGVSMIKDNLFKWSISSDFCIYITKIKDEIQLLIENKSYDERHYEKYSEINEDLQDMIDEYNDIEEQMKRGDLKIVYEMGDITLEMYYNDFFKSFVHWIGKD